MRQSFRCRRDPLPLMPDAVPRQIRAASEPEVDSAANRPQQRAAAALPAPAIRIRRRSARRPSLRSRALQSGIDRRERIEDFVRERDALPVLGRRPRPATRIDRSGRPWRANVRASGAAGPRASGSSRRCGSGVAGFRAARASRRALRPSCHCRRRTRRCRLPRSSPTGSTSPDGEASREEWRHLGCRHEIAVRSEDRPVAHVITEVRLVERRRHEFGKRQPAAAIPRAPCYPRRERSRARGLFGSQRKRPARAQHLHHQPP